MVLREHAARPPGAPTLTPFNCYTKEVWSKEKSSGAARTCSSAARRPRLALALQPDPEAACFTLWDPVCGPNGVTYSNTCKAKKMCQLAGSTKGKC